MTPLARACDALGGAIGARLIVPDGLRSDEPEVARRIALASGVRCREVLLRGPWWTRTGDPLLGFVDGEPVALLPAGRGYGCQLADRPSPMPVDAALAGRMAPNAWSFTPPPPAAGGPHRLLRHTLRRTGGDALTLLVASAAAAVATLAIPLLSGHVVGRLAAGLAPPPTLLLILGLGAIGAALATFELARIIALIRLEARFELAAQSALMDRLLRLPGAFFRQFSAGDLAERVLAVTQLRHALAGALPLAAVTAVAGLANLLLLFALDRRIGGLVLAIGAGAALTMAGLARASYRRSRAIAEADGRLAALGLQLVTGVARIRVAGAERRAFASWLERVAALRQAVWRGGLIDAAMHTTAVAVPILTTLLVFIAFTAPGGDAAPDAGTLTALLVAAQIFLGALLQLGLTLVSATAVLPVLERAAPILTATPEIAAAEGAPAPLDGRVEAHGITFRYRTSGPDVLTDVSIVAEPGEMIAIVGASGSGKSTLLRVLLGLETPNAGRVRIDGTDLDRLDAGAVRRQMGIVLQNGRIFAGTILSHITGSRGGGLTAAWDAARLAAIDADIRAMPMGMHTLLNDGATTISGGQRQRLLLARAIASRPRILLLDEATSALDGRTQERVATALAALGLTRIVVAHRLSTVRYADRIYVLAGGQVVQTGTWTELAAGPGEFARLARLEGASADELPEIGPAAGNVAG